MLIAVLFILQDIRKKLKANRTSNEKKDSQIVINDDKRSLCVCDLCGLCLVNKAALATHRRRHFEENRNIKCKVPDCSKKFFRRTDMLRHYRSMHECKRDLCVYCLLHVMSIDRHQTVCKKFLETQNLHKCRGCRAICNSPENLEQHMLTCEVKSFHCHICGSNFTSQTSLRSHLNIHNTVQTRQCDVCGKNISEQNLQKHLLTHGPDKPCRACGEMTPNGMHKVSECPVKSQFIPQNCPYCQQKISGGRALIQRHVKRKHLSQLNEYLSKEWTTKPSSNFKCEKCRKVFIKYFAYERHTETCGNEQPYQCATCQQQFNTLSKAMAHIKRCKDKDVDAEVLLGL